jgi:hypothetical protein
VTIGYNPRRISLEKRVLLADFKAGFDLELKENLQAAIGDAGAASHGP